MRFIVKRKWLVLLAWIIIVAGLFFMAPNMGDLVREKGQITLPDHYSSKLASEILSEARSDDGTSDTTTIALVLFNEKEKLSAAEIKEAEKAIELLENNKDLGVTEIISHFKEESLKDQLVSQDGKAILASVTLEWNGRDAKEVKKSLYDTLESVDVDYAFTSEWMVNEDLIVSSQEGVRKTEGIAIVFILLVLLLVYRSFVAPFIPLLTVGFSYLAAQSIVAFLVKYVDFPVSTYTQIFLVVVLFGLGTDYCILLLSRFKEELLKQETVTDAIVETYRNGGRTVLFSGLAVMIGFAAIGFSQFIIYQSAAAVAVGIAVLLVALFTIVPFFMSLLAGKLFWPSKMKEKQGDNWLWAFFGKFSLSRPFVSLLVVAAICVPFLIFYDGTLSYNSMDEISDDYGSVKAFNVIADSFSPGEAMRTQVVLKNDEAMDSQEYLALTEQISRELEKVDLVDSVRSVTRPMGEPLEDFLVAKQADALKDGLGEGKDGLSQISSGLQQASSELAKSEPELNQAVDGIEQLISGTSELRNGVSELQTHLAAIEEGIRLGSASSDQIIAGLEEAKKGAEELHRAYETKLLPNYRTMEEGLAGLTDGYTRIGDGLSQIAQSLSKEQQELFNYIENKHQDMAYDIDYQTLKAKIMFITEELHGLSDKMAELNTHLAQIQAGLKAANDGFAEAIAEQNKISAGLEMLISGIEEQQAAFYKLADGQGRIVDSLPQMAAGLSGINDGQQQLLDGFSEIGDQLSQLTDGLKRSADGLDQVSDGLGQAQEYLAGLAQSEETGGFYLPKEALESEEFASVLDVYMSPDRKIMTIDVIFKANPYSNEAMAQIPEIKKAVERATKDTKLENAVMVVGGVTSLNADLDAMSSEDYNRTVIFMLVGIAFILMILFRSFVMPLYIIGSLILTYYTTMAINEVIFVQLLGYSGFTWAVPFFGFVILIALGVDYSIFLMDRFNEYKNLLVEQAMYMAMKKMGTVIISAAIILSGTFAAMMPAGMLSLLEIALITIVGLFLYSFVVLPLFIPVMVKIFGEANWWPFQRPAND